MKTRPAKPNRFRDSQARRRFGTAYWLGLPAFFDRLWEWRARRTGSASGPQQ